MSARCSLKKTFCQAFRASVSITNAALAPPPRVQRHAYFGVLARMAAHGKFPRRHRPAGVGRSATFAPLSQTDPKLTQGVL